MKLVSLRELQDSLSRCSATTAYLDTFYEVFLAKSPEIRAGFQGVDMGVQKQRLAARLPRLLELATCEPTSAEVLEAARLHSARHHGRGAQQTDLWLEALCETFRRHDPDFDASLEEQLRRQMSKVLAWLQPHSSSEAG
ncbi:MAG: hypothetical protein KF760_10375 [Candidatus Eremiobacteraeota bacterium]|nr:hypothetical protein [Candidatus Eremiobacteraeota bacterium]MCW5872389.1 hypothetical protein [Candidatus Eremiobacteraeota bacterium]